MQAIPDDLDKLLGDVKKVIDDNLKFLKSLSGDDEEGDAGDDSGSDEVKSEDEFEEL